MEGRGFLQSTAALITAVGTMLAALVALAALLVTGGIFSGGGGGGGGDGGVGGSVQFERTFGVEGTDGIELDGEKDIVRNPNGDPDIRFYPILNQLSVFKGSIVAWKQKEAPTQKQCADLLETHGATGTYEFEHGSRFCVRSSGGRTAFVAVISDGEEFKVSVWE